jgi:hypothetical protein
VLRLLGANDAILPKQKDPVTANDVECTDELQSLDDTFITTGSRAIAVAELKQLLISVSSVLSPRASLNRDGDAAADSAMPSPRLTHREAVQLVADADIINEDVLSWDDRALAGDAMTKNIGRHSYEPDHAFYVH